MNNSWNKDIRDRLKDFQAKAPEGLLDDIRSEMHRRGCPSVPVADKRPAILFRIASVAAILCVLFTIGHLFQRKEPAVLPAKHESLVVPTRDEAIQGIAKVLPSNPVASSAGHLASKNYKGTTVPPAIPTIRKDSTSRETTIEKTPEETTEDSPQPTPNTRKEPEPYPQNGKWTYASGKRKKSSFALGIYYSGLIAQLDPTRNSGETSINLNSSSNNPYEDDKNDTTAVASRSFSRSFQRKKGGEKARHHLPVKAGVSLRYYLNERWSLQSGLTYSYLASDLSYQSPTTSYRTEQKLHYIGIPLQAGLRIWENKRFRGYISMGGQVEKLVSGKATTRYSTEVQEQGTLIENIHDNRLLFSALASIGAEYMLGKDLSLYTEPGIHCYFKNGNDLKTHYNDQPLNFYMTVGFRFHWNR